MPTVGWIREKDVDAFFAATQIVPPPGPPPAPVWHCPFCPRSFEAAEQLRAHLHDAHSGRRPFITVAGAEPKSSDIIRRRIDPAQVEFFDATSVGLSVDGSSYDEHSPKSARSMLAVSLDRRLWIRLENRFDRKAQPVHTEYDLTFRVYDDERILRAIDERFVSILGKDAVGMDDVNEFVRQTGKFAASEYSAALADYVIGVLVKDGDPSTGISAASRDYRTRYHGALRTLQEFARPLPQLVCALIRFSSNDFDAERSSRTGYGLLDLANARLAPLARGGATWPAAASEPADGSRKRSVCPIDNGSSTAMWRAGQLDGVTRLSRELEAQLAAEAEVPDLDPEDRQKLYALWAATAVRLGKTESALHPLRNLAGSYCFGHWADRLLEEFDG